MPSRFEKIEQYSQILYSMRPGIRKHAWDDTIFKNGDEMLTPTEVINSQVEIEEDQMLKLAFGIDQMFIEGDEDGNEDDFDFVELVPAPEISATETQSEAVEKTTVQSKITAFFTEK